jgi:hypothetical protein
MNKSVRIPNWLAQATLQSLLFTVALLQAEGSQANDGVYCKTYANASISVGNEYRKLKCGPDIPRYSDNWQGHYNWCLSAPRSSVDKEAKVRDQGLATCKSKRLNLLPFVAKQKKNKPNVADTQIKPKIQSTQIEAHNKDISTNAITLREHANPGRKQAHFAKPPSTLKLDWSTLKPGVTEVVYQVFSLRPKSDDTRLRPPGLIEIGISKRQQQNGLSSVGQITIDPWRYTDYVGNIVAGTLGPLPMERKVNLLGAIAVAEATKNIGPPKRTKKPPSQTLKLVHLANLKDQPRKLYVRVIPIVDNKQVATFASDNFEIVLPNYGSSAYKPYTPIVRFEPGYEPDFFQANCVRVTDFVKPSNLGIIVEEPETSIFLEKLTGKKLTVGWPKITTNSETSALFFSRIFYPTTGTFCPGDWKSSGCSGIDCIGKAIQDGFETIADTYDSVLGLIKEIKSTVISLSAAYNPFCMQADLISGDAGDACETIIDVGTHVVVDTYLVANGIPPDLPTSDQLESAAKGDLTEISVSVLEQLGVPCDELTLTEAEARLVKSAASTASEEVKSVNVDNGVDLCRDLSRAVIDELHKKLESQISQQVAKAAGVPHFDNIAMIPEPRGQWQPPRVIITLLPNGVPLRAEQQCPATVSVSGSPTGGIPFVTPKSVEPYKSKTIQLPLEGQNPIFYLRGVQLSQSGSSKTNTDQIKIIPTNPVTFSSVSVVLDKPNPVKLTLNPNWIQQRKASYKHAPDGHRNLQLQGSKLTATIESPCFETARITETVALASSRPSGFPKGKLPNWYADWWRGSWRKELCQRLPSHPHSGQVNIDNTARSNAYQWYRQLECATR